jgi:hypothetical protein
LGYFKAQPAINDVETLIQNDGGYYALPLKEPPRFFTLGRRVNPEFGVCFFDVRKANFFHGKRHALTPLLETVSTCRLMIFNSYIEQPMLCRSEGDLWESP